MLRGQNLVGPARKNKIQLANKLAQHLLLLRYAKRLVGS